MRRVLAVLLIVSFLMIPGLTTAQDNALFTIQADEALQPAISALYAASFAGAAPGYVTENADLLITSDAAALAAATAALPDYFLPGAGMVAASDNADASAFVDFAVSPDGQQVLIDAGFLPASVTVTDQAGNTVEIPQPVRKVITPHSIATYTVYGVGGADRLVAAGFLGAREEPGVSRMTLIDPHFPDIASTTMSQKEINIEEVAHLAPDVILTSKRSQWLDAVAELNIPVVLFEGETPDKLQEAVQIIGKILGPNTAAHADAWIAYYDSVLAKIAEETAGVSTPPTILIVGSEPLRVASGEMYQSFMAAAAGGKSVSADLTGYWNDSNLEQILVWNPGIIVAVPYSNGSVDTIKTSAEWQVANAVKNGKVYEMPSYVAPWDTPVPESVLGVIWLAKTLYPDQVDLDCATEVSYFYRTFYDYEMPEAELAALCGS